MRRWIHVHGNFHVGYHGAGENKRIQQSEINGAGVMNKVGAASKISQVPVQPNCQVLEGIRQPIRAGRNHAASSVIHAIRAGGKMVQRAWIRYLRRRNAMATRAALHKLDDLTLRDIGVDRSEIESLAREVAGASERTRMHARLAPGLRSN